MDTKSDAQIKEIAIAFVGSGGDGVVTIGDMLTSSASKDGLFCFELKSYGPQIRGGESSCHVRIAEDPILTQGEHTDILVVLSWKDYVRFKDEITFKSDVVIVYDQDDPSLKNEFPIPLTGHEKMYPIPFKKIAEEKMKNKLTKNVVALGTVTALFGFNRVRLEELIKEKFARKGEEVTKINLGAFHAGIEFVEQNITKNDPILLNFPIREPNIVIGGNEALAYGALFSGCRFYAGYPITPSTEIMQWMSQYLPKYGGTFMQAEDELASIGMVLGASYGGVKAMTATSGPGFSLMQETIGLMAMSETPAVIVDVQRVGPSTGIPTKTEQSDLGIAVYGSHGDVPRIVLAPADVEDCFEVAVDAFNIAEHYQTPVIILSDQFIGQRKESLRPLNFSKFKTEYRKTIEPKLGDAYKRFQITTNGVSPVAVPGTPNGMYINAGIEHNEMGYPTSGSGMHEVMNDKRFRKFNTLAKEYKFIRRYGNPDAKLGIITWGSCKGAVKEAIYKAVAEGLSVVGFVPTLISPLQTDLLEEYFRTVEHLIVIELSHSAQFFKHIAANMPNIKTKIHPFNRSGGNPLTVSEIYDLIAKRYKEYKITALQTIEVH